MPRSRVVLAVAVPLALIAVGGCNEGRIDSPPEGGGATIVELEGRFAAASRERGARAAFLEFLAEDSIVLRPGPVWGRAAWEAAPDSPVTLDWKPDRAQLAADGRFGFSTGPWTLTRAEGGAMLEGRYVTVWRQTGDGWRVVFDGGLVGSGAATEGPVRLDEARCQGDTEARAGDLQALDIELSAGEFGEQLREVAASGLVLFHAPNAAGAEGMALEAAIAALSPTGQLLPMGAGLATSGDLGYTYGLAAPSVDASADAAYVHIWCRAADGWRLLLELRAPLPAQASQGTSDGSERRD